MNQEKLVSLIKKATSYSGALDLDSINPLAQELVQEFALELSVVENLIIGYGASIVIDGLGSVTVPDFVEDEEAARLIREDNIPELVKRICARE